MSEHTCDGSGVQQVKTVRSTGPRKKPQDHPVCPHCKGRMHFSAPGGLINTECIARQYFIDKGQMADPYAKLPIFGLSELKEIVTWADDVRDFTYGKMDAPGGGSGTFASLRPKVAPENRKRKTKAAEKGQRIEDMAQQATGTDEQAPGLVVNDDGEIVEDTEEVSFVIGGYDSEDGAPMNIGGDMPATQLNGSGTIEMTPDPVLTDEEKKEAQRAKDRERKAAARRAAMQNMSR